MAKEQTAVAAVQPESRPSKFKSFFKKSNKKAAIVLTEEELHILKKVKRRAKVLDTGINLGFARFGLDPIIGLIPVAGDTVTLFMAWRLIHTAQQANIPRSLTHKMLFNVCVDFGMGLVPVVGDFADFLFKANDRNAKLFEAFLYERAGRRAAEEEAAAAAAARNLAQSNVAGRGGETVIQMEPAVAGGAPIPVK
ncbi:hypothetical protein BGX28_003683 [Mortierella sp. GBA30]|nr:hypothetical protein BGX28_003683 [Mortierella sp. GBA30]